MHLKTVFVWGDKDVAVSFEKGERAHLHAPQSI